VRYAAPRMGRPRRHKTVVNSQAVESKPGVVSRLENSMSIASGAAGSLGDLPKNCHLLPSTAFWSDKIATSVSIVPFPFLPLERCRPACARAENRERAVRSLGETLSTSAACPMTGESTESQKMMLATAVADGAAVENWKSRNEVPERTAYRWAAENKNQWTCISRRPDWLFQFVAFHPSLLLATLKWRVAAVGGGFTPTSPAWLQSGIKRDQTRMAAGGR
jgi:hypothetical protein